MAINLSRITKVNPREIWRHEALDFTQWLAKVIREIKNKGHVVWIPSD